MEFKTFGTGSKGNCYLLKGEHASLLLEIGIPFKQLAKKMNYDFKQVAGCLITHEHTDHCLGVKEFVECTEINLYGTRWTLDNLGIVIPTYRKNVLNYNKTYKIDEFDVTAFKVNHDANQPAGFFIRNDTDKMVFITDTNKLDYYFKDLTHIVIESNYSDKLLEQSDYHESLKKRIRKSHLEINQAIDFIKTCQKNSDRIKSVTLIHYSNANADYNNFKEMVERETGIRTYIAEKER